MTTLYAHTDYCTLTLEVELRNAQSCAPAVGARTHTDRDQTNLKHELKLVNVVVLITVTLIRLRNALH